MSRAVVSTLADEDLDVHLALEPLDHPEIPVGEQGLQGELTAEQDASNGC